MVTPTGFDPAPGHVYLSTGCLHGEHVYCQSMIGTQGEKRPGRCKFCNAQCVCPCHRPGGLAGVAAEVLRDVEEDR